MRPQYVIWIVLDYMYTLQIWFLTNLIRSVIRDTYTRKFRSFRQDHSVPIVLLHYLTWHYLISLPMVCCLCFLNKMYIELKRWFFFYLKTNNLYDFKVNLKSNAKNTSSWACADKISWNVHSFRDKSNNEHEFILWTFRIAR